MRKQSSELPDTLTIRWVPHWYGMDPSLALGKSVVVMASPASQGVGSELSGRASYRFEFCQQVEPEPGIIWAEGTVIAIHHDVLGEVAAIETCGLDYTYLLASGRQVVVNAEEEPGTTPDLLESINDWGVEVTLANLRWIDDGHEQRHRSGE